MRQFKLLFVWLILFLSLVSISPSTSNAWWFSRSNESRMEEGEWTLGSAHTYKFQKGFMINTISNRVYATYKFIDRDSMYFKYNDDHNQDFIVTVEFESNSSMIWYLKRSNELIRWREFTR